MRHELRNEFKSVLTVPMATACSLMIPLMIPSFKSYNLIHVGPNGAHLSFPGMRYSIVQRLPDWAYLPGWSSTGAHAHGMSFTQTMCAAKRRPPHMQKCLRRQNYSLIDRARDRAGLSSRQRQTEPCSAFRIDARRGSSDLAQ